MELIEKSTRDEVTTMMRNNVRMRVAGRMSDLPDSMRESFEFACRETAGNTGITFTLAVNYGGRAEIVDAVRGLVASGISPEDITEEAISKAMYQPENPDPDVIVRTAGEMRLSNFMIYQAAYAELVVTPVTWPEFKQNDLFDCIADFQNRERKFGGLEII
jgi:undecaprenyl diphosphate synthase